MFPQLTFAVAAARWLQLYAALNADGIQFYSRLVAHRLLLRLLDSTASDNAEFDQSFGREGTLAGGPPLR